LKVLQSVFKLQSSQNIIQENKNSFDLESNKELFWEQTFQMVIQVEIKL
jgi:hypothetical protein